jgi:hypothetical protein
MRSSAFVANNVLVIATLPQDAALAGTFIDAARGERLETAHDFRDGVASFGLISQDDYSVHVVGHDNEGVQINAMVMRRQVIPSLLRNQICCTIVPFSFSRTSPSMTSTKSMTRFCVQAVMKYAPA